MRFLTEKSCCICRCLRIMTPCSPWFTDQEASWAWTAAHLRVSLPARLLSCQLRELPLKCFFNFFYPVLLTCSCVCLSAPSFLPELPVCCCSPGPDRSPAWRTASPVSPPSIRSSSAALSSSLPGGRGEMEADILQSADPFPWAESSENCLDEEAALRGPKSPVLERNLEPPGNRWEAS